ncbi:S8 family serine peptidase [Knoellia aerolata]|uniref:Peptidase S8/S53 domain-containing protein n=1 Tax=Knoellia aerolata DSM 18566 TaxID=1385519 RepID=A0A0A0JWF5_9MICO|nr:S8 family serine peptidase [Knoellia aerolata]KGN39946.1 hypothetical protein N801_17725 [Knoellia aerolata DSM 18566]
MDPALWELLREDVDTDRELEAIIRFAHPDVDPPEVRVVARFGTIATCRVRAGDVLSVRSHPDVVSLKAARRLSPTYETGPAGRMSGTRPAERLHDTRRDPRLVPTGAGVVVSAVDWGIDPTCASFRHPPGQGGGTRILSLWDQRDAAVGPRLAPYGYGAVHDAVDIDRALADPFPLRRLGYHPAIADRGNGSHGTHVLDIAAGNGAGGGPVGLAPRADLVFVHLADRDTGGLANLGDSVRLLEAVDFISRTAGPRPWVANLSVGRHGGPHDGTTLTELAFDELLDGAPGRFIVQSAGNYYRSRTHASGILSTGESQSFRFRTHPADVTANELEIWSDHRDAFAIRVEAPDGTVTGPVAPGHRAELRAGRRVVGRIYHRAADPNNGDNHVDAFLDPTAPSGMWTVTVEAGRVTCGRFDAWLERDDACRRCQTRFAVDDSDRTATTGTIANGHLPLIVGAYGAQGPLRRPGRFSSVGPTRDGRPKPDLVAPGVNVLAARSAPALSDRNEGLLVRKSGTSMAAPHVTGSVALCLELAGDRMTARRLRAVVLATCQTEPSTWPEPRLGHGYLDTLRLTKAVGRLMRVADQAVTTEGLTMPTDPILTHEPAVALRELVYRPSGPISLTITRRYDVIARPGQSAPRDAKTGDLLLEMTLGRRAGGRCVNLDDTSLRELASKGRLGFDQLILRPRPPHDTTVAPANPASDDSAVDAEDDADLDRLVQQGLSENQITNALFYARHPSLTGVVLRAGSATAREWRTIRDAEVRPGLRSRLQVGAVDPVQLAVFLSQYENDSRVPAEYTKRFLTRVPLLSMGRSLRDRVLANWRGGASPLTTTRFFALAVETAGNPGVAALLCHNVAKAFVREGAAITWRATGTEGEYSDGQKTYTAAVIHRAGRLRYYHGGKGRDVVSIFYLLFSDREFGTQDPGDWYHFFVTATMSALSSGGSLAATRGRGGRQGEGEDGEDRSGVGGVVYRGLMADRIMDLERQMTDATLRPVPGYRGWVLANVLSFLEGGHYGKDFSTGQDDVARESKVHLRGAAFGLSTVAGKPGPSWRWYVPKAGSLSDTDLALGFSLPARTAEVWGPDAKPRPSEEVDGSGEVPDDTEDAPQDLVKRAQTWWNTAYGKDKLLSGVRIAEYETVPSEAVRELSYDAWTNSPKSIYVASTAHKNAVTLETVLRHEAVHIRQFLDRGRPNTYERTTLYELEAYREGVPRLESRLRALDSLTNPTTKDDAERDAVTEQLETIRSVIRTLEDGLAHARTLKTTDQQERSLRRLLIGHCLLPYHRSLGDLYAPRKDQRNPAATETVDELADDLTDGPAGDQPEDSDGPAHWDGVRDNGTTTEQDLTPIWDDEFEREKLADIVTEEAGGPPALSGAEEMEGRVLDSAEFAGSEHKDIGDTGSGRESSSIPFGNPPRALSFGDVVSLAGDYYETYEQMRDLGRTSGGREELEWARWHCLALKKKGIPEPSVDAKTADRVVDRYHLLASRNLSHFAAGGTAWQTYAGWHGQALADALESGQTSDDKLWRRALTKDAFAAHFLTDMFAAGHVRTPRRDIRDWYARHQPGPSDAFVAYMAQYLFERLDARHQLPPLLWWMGWVTKSTMRDRIRVLGGEAVSSFSLGDIVALALHDRDNKGLNVVSDVGPDGRAVLGGYAWRAVGDGHLGRIPYGPETKAMATAGVIASLRDLERVRGAGRRLGSGTVSLAQKADAIRTALGTQGFAARAYVPRESRVPGANPSYSRADGTRAELEWRWGQLGPQTRAAVDEAVRTTIAQELLDMASELKEPIEAPLGIRVYGIQNAFRDFVRHLREEGIGAVERAVGKPAG